jgi:hypothetical protein
MLDIFPVKLQRVGDVLKKVPAVPKGVSWKDYKANDLELEDAKNIGVIIPKGVIAFDVDTYKGCKLEDIDSALGISLNWKDAFLQQTIKGGEHYAFRVDEDLPQSNDLLGVKGFDTRCSGKGWLCSGEGYKGDIISKLEHLDDLPKLPIKAVLALKNKGFSKSSSIDEDDFDLHTFIDNEPIDWTREEVERAVLEDLEPINAPYHDWLEVGMALHHQSQGAKWGGNLFNKWCKGCQNYNRDEVLQKWLSFDGNANKLITFKSLIKRYGLSRYGDIKAADNAVKERKRLTTMTLDLINQVPKQRELIGGRFPVKCTSAVVAMGGCGKTTWLVREAVRLASEGVNTLFVSSEDGPEDYQSKIYNAVRGEDVEYCLDEIAEKLHIFDLRGVGTKLVVEDRGSYRPSDSVQDVLEVAKQVDAKLVVFETLSRFAGGEENERFEAVVTACDAIATGFGGAVVLVHHTGKSAAREKVIDLYSGRGGSVLGDNTRSMTVLTKIDDDYDGEKPVLASNEDIKEGRVFEVNHVRCSYAQTCESEYYATRSGECGPWLESLTIATEEELRERQLKRMNEEKAETIQRVLDCIEVEGGTVGKSYFETKTKDKIGVSQKEGRLIIEQMIQDALVIDGHVPTKSGQRKAVLRIPSSA